MKNYLRFVKGTLKRTFSHLIGMKELKDSFDALREASVCLANWAFKVIAILLFYVTFPVSSVIIYLYERKRSERFAKAKKDALSRVFDNKNF